MRIQKMTTNQIKMMRCPYDEESEYELWFDWPDEMWVKLSDLQIALAERIRSNKHDGASQIFESVLKELHALVQNLNSEPDGSTHNKGYEVNQK